MANASKLTLALMDKRPAAAARVLETLSTDDAAAFVEAIPTRYAIKALELLNTALISEIAQRLPVSTNTALVREMEFALASAVLRRLPEAQRSRIMAELPDKRRMELQTAMRFAPDTVGANMSLAVVTASCDETVGDALKRFKEDRLGHSDAVYLIDESHKVLGLVPLAVLVRQRTKTLLRDILDERCPHLVARSRVSQIASVPAWQQHRQLPVISRRGELIGVIFRQAVSADTDVVSGDSVDQPSVIESVLQMMLGQTPTHARSPAVMPMTILAGEINNDR